MLQRSIMQTPVSDLSHMQQPYDPAAAHLYYLRTRQLKGRQPAAIKTTTTRPPAKVVLKTPIKPKAKPVVLSKKEAAKLSAEAAKQVAALQKRLAQLRIVLRELVKLAKARSGIKTPPSKTHPAVGAAKLTPTEQKKAAAAAHAYYEKHKAQTKAATPSEQKKQLEAQIKQIEAKIAAMRAQLKLAVAKAQQTIANHPSASKV